MAGALFSAIVERLGSIISSEFKLTVTVKEEVQKLETKFRTIPAVLNDAEKRQLKEEAVKLWLDKLEGVSYEIDDVLDEWNTVMIKAEIEKQQKEFEEEEKAETSTTKKRKVLPLISNFHFSVPNLLQHRDIAHKIKDLNEKLDQINKEKEMYGFELSRAIEEVVERPKTTSYVDVSEILGRDKVKNDLVSTLLGKGTEKKKHPHVISLVGMGGIGKTTLAQLAFNHHEVKDHFQERIWVCVSEPFNQCRVAKTIVEALAGGDPKITELQSLLEKICDLIGGKECFFVFDDVWTEDYAMWKPFRDALKSCGSQSSRILVTTRKDKVAKMMESTNTIKLEELSEEDCWLVFSKIAFFDKDPKQCEQLEDPGRQISKKCKGLPLAAKTLGSLMHFKKSKEEWEMVLCSSMWELEDVERGLFAPLLLSYHDLPSPLKQCFLYCGVFPKNYVFSSDELVFMWMAQGYIKPKINMEIEIIAREYFENLAIRSFFQDFKKVEDDDKIIRCKMHDIVHDFAQLMSKNECIGSSGVELGLYYKNIHHLQVEIPKYSHFPEGVYNAKNLRTLILVYQNGYILSNLFRHFRCLRILTLTCQDDNMFKELPDAVGNFMHLRYLNLVNYCGYVLPETICNLCNLQILKISFGIARVKKLPQGMGKLINLRHLTLDCLYFGLDLEFPRGFGRLVSLRTLSHFNISGKDDSEGCKLGELKNLNLLQGALQIRRLGNVLDACEAEDAQLKEKIYLHTLFLRFDGSDCEDCEDIRNNDGLILNGLVPPPCLEYLCIEEYRATTMSTNWMMSLTILKKLDIRYAFLEHLPPLGKLLFLESLHIDNAIYLKKVGVEFLGIESKKKKDNIIVFPSLKYLTFESLYEWKEWIGIGGEEEEEDCITIMPHLEKLTIRSCEMLLSLPDFLRKSPTKQLVIHNCCYLSKCCEEEEWPKISHIPHIIIDYKYVQRGQEYIPELEEKIVLEVQMNSQKCQTKALTVAAEANEGAEKDKVLVIGEGVDAISLAATMRRKADIEAISVAEVNKEDFPRTPSPVYSQSNLLSQGVVDEAVDHDALIGTSNGVSSNLGSDDRRISSDSDPLAAPTSSSSSHDRTGRADVNDSDVTAMESQKKSLNISNLPNSENQKNQEQWQYSSQNNLLQHQVHQQQSNLSQSQSAKSRVISQDVNCAYIGVDQVLHNPSKFAEVQPVLQSSGFTPPLYTTAAACMVSTKPFYPNLQAPGLYSPQFVGGYALNPAAVPPYIAGYTPNGAVPVVVDGTAGPSYTAQTSGVSTGGNIAHRADVQHLSKLFGQFGFPLQGSFGDPIYMQSHQHPYGEAYSGITGQLDPLASRGGVNIGNQASVLDSQRGSNNAGYLEDHKFGHQINGGPSHFNPGRGGMMSPSYYGSPSNMGFAMQYPNSPLASPVLPGSPVGGTSIPGGRNEMRFAPGSCRNAGVYPGWQGQRGFESFGNPKIYNFLEELKSGKGRRFELSDIVGHIVEFSADQHGSRFIQQKLENCTGEEKASAFKEVLPHASKLMTDVFGNYVIQKFFEYGSPEQRKELANQLTGQVLPLSLQMYGCRVIQKALEVIEPEQKAQLVRELDGHVMRCVRDQNGNHVIQKCIESVPTERIGFIISAFRGQVAMLSMHPYGCRVIQRVLEHCTNELQCQFIVDEILESVCTLAQDQYGNYVTQHVLERGKPHERSQIISKLSGHIVQLSQHKFASNVIEKCLEYGGPTECELLIGEIFGHNEGTDNLLTMMKDQFANYVVQKILEVCSDNQRAVLLARVRVHAHILKRYTYGKHIVARFEQLFGEENPVADRDARTRDSSRSLVGVLPLWHVNLT